MSEIVEENYELEEDTQKDKYLTFDIGNEQYGINIKYVIEIIGIQDITEMPEQPIYVKGIINLRGKIIPVIDVRLRFKKEFRPYNDRTCIIVVDIVGMSIGLIVDSVEEVVDIQEQDIVNPPKMNENEKNKYLKGIGKIGDKVKLLLDCEKLLNDKDKDAINDAI
ncbi:MAG: chemotaxis protein CheW [Eubacteriales bacterium]